jgi:hypothetical protein
MKANTQTLYNMKEKAKAKLEVLKDKAECALEISENNTGGDLTRALNGLQANRGHLKIAEDLLEQCRKEEDALLDGMGEVEESMESELEGIKTIYEASIAEAKRLFAKKTKEIEAKYSKTTKKAVKKTSERMTILLQRVARYQIAVANSLESVERLQSNKPKAIIRAEFESKKPERDLAFVRNIEEMNAQQATSRDVKSSVAVESYPENTAPIRPKKQVKQSTLPRSMPPETAEEKAYWGSLTGVDMDELQSLKKMALAEDEAHRKSVKG